MEVSTEARPSVRLLGLGNDILADDAFGIRVAEEARRRFGAAVDVVSTSDAGFHLIDHLVGTSRLVLVDTVLTGTASPGTIRMWNEDETRPVPGGSPHSVGFFEVLAVARRLDLPVPKEIVIITVEAADCTTVGGAMHPDVEAAVPLVVELVGQALSPANSRLFLPAVEYAI